MMRLILFVLGLTFYFSGWNDLESESRIAFPIVSPQDHDLRLHAGGIVSWKGRPFTGTLMDQEETGRVKSQQYYLLGKRHGPQVTWYPDGKVETLRHYRDNRPHGWHRGWWPNGQIKFETEYVRGEAEGTSYEWYENGRIFMIRNFHKGQEVGSQRAWGVEGEVYSNYVIKEGKRYGLLGSKPCYTVKN